MNSNFQLFGFAHLAILCAVLLLAAVLALLQRRLPARSKVLRLGFGIGASRRYFFGGTGSWPGIASSRFHAHLPIELCDLTLYLTLIALFTLSAAVFELAYYFALAGTAMALLTPDLWEPFPQLSTVQFFAAHGLVVAARSLPCLVAAGLGLAAGSVMRAMLALNVWAAFDGAFDWLFKTNYMYLRAKPGSCLSARPSRSVALVHRLH